MTNHSEKIKPNVRLLVFIVSLPFWVLLGIQVCSMWLGDPYRFDMTHLLFIPLVYLFFRIVILGKNPLVISLGRDK